MKKADNIREIELLAPARDADTGIEAVRHGADAVYIGPSGFGARAAAGNPTEEIARLCDYAHRYDARVYATVNTIIYDNELREVERLIAGLYRVGVDALIVQDMALLRLDLPPIDLHASTQCDIRTPERARWLAGCGFSQLVLPREMTLDEMAAVRDAVGPDVALEAFVHGALCVSYSGDCQASCIATGRSANRGECAQLCRLPYDLTDSEGHVLVAGKHLLSLRDLDRSALLGEMTAAGVTSFKIEGRLKDTGYVKNVTAYYNRLLDEIVGSSGGRLCRASSGRSVPEFVPDLHKSFNRGFTQYFTAGAQPDSAMGSPDTPKWRGEPVGKVLSVKGRMIRADLTAPLANGDGLGWTDPRGGFTGFRLNRAEGDRLFAASDIAPVPRGTVIYRNRDKARDDMMSGTTARRRIDVTMALRSDAAGRPVIDVCQPGRCSVTVTDGDRTPVEAARSDQAEAHRRALTRTGDTIYDVVELDDRIAGSFIPLSRLTALRRIALDCLERARLATRPVKLRRPERTVPQLPEGMRSLTYHDNVANRVARQLYLDAGAGSVEPALETLTPAQRRSGERRVMTTRYCVRRELGECMMRDRDRRLPDGPLWLRSGDRLRLRLDFDCRRCRMEVVY